MDVVLYLHGKGGSAAEAARYRPLFPACDVIGLDYKAETPWEAASELQAEIAALREEYESVYLIANSIGAYYALHAGIDRRIAHAWLISPVVDMEALIAGMMAQAGVSEEELERRGVIETDSGTLSWDYLQFVRTHPIVWDAPTDLLYGSGDALTSRAAIEAFAAAHKARLRVMEGGEHWFHTDEQQRFLDDWIASTAKDVFDRQTQLRRIVKYETLTREAEALLAAGDCGAALKEKLAALEAYYTSDTWKRDFADDEAGKFPNDLPRGVLSEDGIYNLLERYKERMCDE